MTSSRPLQERVEFRLTHNDSEERLLREKLRHQERWFVLAWIEYRLGREIRADETGNVFERCLEWCGQHGGGAAEKVVPLVRSLFDHFFVDLPEGAQASFEPVADTIEFDTRKAHSDRAVLDRRIALFKEWAVWWEQPWNLKKALPLVSRLQGSASQTLRRFSDWIVPFGRRLIRRVHFRLPKVLRTS